MKDISTIVKKHYLALAKEYQTLSQLGTRFSINEKRFEEFEDSFRSRRDFVMENYMDKTVVKGLDRHKLSAIAIIELIRAHVVTLREQQVRTESNLLLDEYLLATHTGFELMRYWLNQELEKSGQQIVSAWHLPELLSSTNDEYYKVFARNLFFTFERSEDNALKGFMPRFETRYNELELAEKLFLFEQITLIKDNVNMELLSKVTR